MNKGIFNNTTLLFPLGHIPISLPLARVNYLVLQIDVLHQLPPGVAHALQAIKA
jgi:hypothetical protein